MNLQTAKTQFYQMTGFTTAWPEYIKKLAAIDEMESWAARPAAPLSSKLPPKTIKKNLISKTVSILSRELHRDLP